MRDLTLIAKHAYYLTLENLRQPMYVISTVVFPSLFFWFFGIPNAPDEDGLAMLTASFCAFGVLSVVLFQFGIGIANDRESTWYSYLRILPGPRGLQMSSRILSGFLFACLSVAGVLMTAKIFGELNFQNYLWLQFAVVLLLGAIPFSCLGLLLGLLVSARSATPVLNLVYLTLSFAGGLWMPPEVLPKLVREISTYLPSRIYGELLWASVLNRPLENHEGLGLAAYGLGFFLILAVALHREEDKTFR